jgi:hypothetical protein
MANAQLNYDDNFDIKAESAKLGIDIRSLNLDDDNDDQIMSIIGKRPVASSSSSISTSVSDSGESNDGIFVDAECRLRLCVGRKSPTNLPPSVLLLRYPPRRARTGR